ncbi:MAG: maleylpyruvate isomerase family mycothiol-dependent enzyme [Actinomycetota bacterium]|nr:maleylpyruvate isomerase family mycothiol-dependent enzyme [Actinomycetota bacterium]
MDLVRLYSDAQARVIDLVTPLSPPALATWVPGTPRWRIEQLVAHLTGVAADMADGNSEGAATEPWTTRQVEARQGRLLADLVAEWCRRTPEVLELLATPGRVDACAFDLLTHEHDVRGALGLAGPSDPDAVKAVTERVTQRLNHLVGKNGLPALRLVNDNDAWVCGSGDVVVTGVATTTEWFRSLFGRRSAGQILTYTWEGDPTPYFGIFNLFGPLPPADVAEAGAPAPGV